MFSVLCICLLNGETKPGILAFFFVNFTQTKVTWEEGNSAYDLSLADRPMSMYTGHFLNSRLV